MTACVSGPLAQASIEERVVLDARTQRVPFLDQTTNYFTKSQLECLVWQGKGARVRFRGSRWVPRRLLYALDEPGNADAMRGKTLEPTCPNEHCVEPTHQRIVPYNPPKRSSGKKRAYSATPPQLSAEVMEKVRTHLFNLQTTLKRIDAASASVPLELRGTDAQKDAEQRAMTDATQPLMSDLVAAPTTDKEAEYLRQLEADPFRTILYGAR